MIHWLWLIPTFLMGSMCGVMTACLAVAAKEREKRD
jgi:hypothetical protein